MPLQCGTCTRTLFSCSSCGHTGCANSHCGANAFQAGMRCPRCGGMAQKQNSLGALNSRQDSQQNSWAQPQPAAHGDWDGLNYGNRPAPSTSAQTGSALAPLVIAGVQALVRSWRRRQGSGPHSAD